MCRLFIFPNERTMKSFFPEVGLTGDHALIFEKNISKEYLVNGGPIQSYSYYHYADQDAIFYQATNSKKLIVRKLLKYSHRQEMFKQMMEYSEICIVSLLGEVDDYFSVLYNYLLSLSDFNNNCLPITICDDDVTGGNDLDSFNNRVSLLSHINTSQPIKRYRNKEFMNIETKKYFKSVYNMDLNFDDIVMLKLTEVSVKNLTNYPYYLLNNTLVNIDLFTLEESFLQIETYYEAGYYTSYERMNDICVRVTEAYEEFKSNLISKKIDYIDIYNTFDNASRFDHYKFKEHIIKYFKKLEKIHKQENVCN